MEGGNVVPKNCAEEVAILILVRTYQLRFSKTRYLHLYLLESKHTVFCKIRRVNGAVRGHVGAVPGQLGAARGP